MGFDLHVHTTASDGLFTPAQVINEALRLGLTGVAITDHDTTDGIEEALAEVRRLALGDRFLVIPGIELNTEGGEREIHILGYFIDWHHPRLLQRLGEVLEARGKRVINMVEKLNHLGIKVSVEEVRQEAKGEVIGRPHVAQVLIKNGYVSSVKEAFERYIGRNGPAYVPRYKFEPSEAIQLIKEAGGVPVLAHPGLIGDDGLTRKLIHLGVKGLEVYYPEHSKADERRYLAMAEEYGLIVTGGSDFHGDPNNRAAWLGSVAVDGKVVKDLGQRSKPKEGFLSFM